MNVRNSRGKLGSAMIAGMSLATLVVLTGCASAPAAPPSAPHTGTPSSSLAATVRSYEKPGTSYPVPTKPISGVASLKGKTVYFIPITSQAPQFGVTGAALKAALNRAGINLQICSGNASPSTIAACISQATAAKAGAIIADSIPYGLGANAFDAAQAKGIPVLITDQIPDAKQPASSTLGYIQGPGSALLKAVADWIIVDSSNNAHVVINVDTDTPSTQTYVKVAQKEFTSKCPDCSVTLNPISSANFALIAPSTSSALLKTPGVNYVVSEFDEYLQPTQGGVQQSGKAATVKGTSTAAQITGLQMLKTKNFLWVDGGQASSYQGWADADAALRLMTKTALPNYTIPFRLFTRDNVSSVAITDAAQASGEWYGPTNFPSKFAKLWGLK